MGRKHLASTQLTFSDGAWTPAAALLPAVLAGGGGEDPACLAACVGRLRDRSPVLPVPRGGDAKRVKGCTANGSNCAGSGDEGILRAGRVGTGGIGTSSGEAGVVAGEEEKRSAYLAQLYACHLLISSPLRLRARTPPRPDSDFLSVGRPADGPKGAYNHERSYIPCEPGARVVSFPHSRGTKGLNVAPLWPEHGHGVRSGGRDGPGVDLEWTGIC